MQFIIKFLNIHTFEFSKYMTIYDKYEQIYECNYDFPRNL